MRDSSHRRLMRRRIADNGRRHCAASVPSARRGTSPARPRSAFVQSSGTLSATSSQRPVRQAHDGAMFASAGQAQRGEQSVDLAKIAAAHNRERAAERRPPRPARSVTRSRGHDNRIGRCRDVEQSPIEIEKKRPIAVAAQAAPQPALLTPDSTIVISPEIPNRIRPDRSPAYIGQVSNAIPIKSLGRYRWSLWQRQG